MTLPTRPREGSNFRSTLLATFLAACSLLVGCEGAARSPTAPPAPPPPPPGEGSSLRLEISADLEANSRLVLIAWAELLYDGSTVDTVSRCLDPRILVGCRKVRLTASTTTTRGGHAVALQLRSHFFDLLPYGGSASYDCVGTATVRDASGVLQEIPLGRRTASLAPGDSVTYSIDVLP